MALFASLNFYLTACRDDDDNLVNNSSLDTETVLEKDGNAIVYNSVVDGYKQKVTISLDENGKISNYAVSRVVDETLLNSSSEGYCDYTACRATRALNLMGVLKPTNVVKSMTLEIHVEGLRERVEVSGSLYDWDGVATMCKREIQVDEAKEQLSPELRNMVADSIDLPDCLFSVIFNIIFKDYSDFVYSIDEQKKSITINGIGDKDWFDYSAVIPSVVCIDSITYNITSISDSAFADCLNLTSVTIPGSVKVPGMYAFYGCKNLTSATLQNGIPYVDTGMFCDCENLTSVSIPESVTHIWSVAFSGCKSLASLTLPSKLAKIEGTVFRNCPSLKTITCLALTPPEMRADGTTFNGFDRSQCTLIVPQGCSSAYRSAEGWHDFGEIIER